MSNFEKICATYSLPVDASGRIVILDDDALDRILAVPFEVEKHDRDRPFINIENLACIRSALDDSIKLAIASSLTGFLPKKELKQLRNRVQVACRVADWMTNSQERMDFVIEWKDNPNDNNSTFECIAATIKDDATLTLKRKKYLQTGLKALKVLQFNSSRFESLCFPPPLNPLTWGNLGVQLDGFKAWVDNEIFAYEEHSANPSGPKQKHHLRELYRDLSGLLTLIDRLRPESNQTSHLENSQWPRLPKIHDVMELREYGSPFKRMIYQVHREVYEKIPQLEFSPSPDFTKLKSLWQPSTDGGLDKNIKTWINTVKRDGEALPLLEGSAEVMSLRLPFLKIKQNLSK